MVIKMKDKPVILAVDDNSSVLKSINFFLRELYTVRTLVDPEKLQGLLEAITPDMFIFDYNMPELNGFDLIRLIRSVPEHENTPVIFITSEGKAEHISEALSLGACDYFVKPIDGELLREKVAIHLDGYLQRRSQSEL